MISSTATVMNAKALMIVPSWVFKVSKKPGCAASAVRISLARNSMTVTVARSPRSTSMPEADATTCSSSVR